MIGDVWEWTSDFWSTRHPADPAKACCAPQNPRGGPAAESFDPCQPPIRIPRKVIKAMSGFGASCGRPGEDRHPARKSDEASGL